jgi:hypothetical protein
MTGTHGTKVAVWMAVSALLLPSARLEAQRRRVVVPDLKNTAYLGLGYVANVPHAFAGGAVLAMSPGILGGAGLYADVKFSPSTPARAPRPTSRSA